MNAYRLLMALLRVKVSGLDARETQARRYLKNDDKRFITSRKIYEEYLQKGQLLAATFCIRDAPKSQSHGQRAMWLLLPLVASEAPRGEAPPMWLENVSNPHQSTADYSGRTLAAEEAVSLIACC
nr:hypothetical protein Iba_chr07dCG0460 [Ipomoea batatas]